VQRFLSAAILLVSAPAVYGWGSIGHRIVGRIAENHLTGNAAQAVAALIGPETLPQVAMWPDEIRSNPAWDHAAPWHYISIDDGETLATTARSEQGDVVEAMDRFVAILRDPLAVRQNRIEALKFLVHFVGDVHQPLHAGKRADRGGNTIKLTWFGRPTNLHTVWDTDIIDSEKLSFSEFAAFLDHPTAEQVSAWQAATRPDWVKESFDLRAAAYETGMGSLGFPYSFQHLPAIKTRLVQAGVRLAGLLNSIFP